MTPPIKAPADLIDASGQSVLFVRFSLPRADLVALFNGGPYGAILGGPAEDKTTQALLCAALQEALYDSDSGPSLAGSFDFIPAPAPAINDAAWQANAAKLFSRKGGKQ